MEQEYVLVQGKRLRQGYTTGTCAAIAAKGAALMLLEQRDVTECQITLPGGSKISLPLIDSTFSETTAAAGVVKDGGDDPDVTTGLGIYAKVSWINSAERVVIKGGSGVGRITRPGLQLPIGEAAINPAPRKMIIQAVESVLPSEKSVQVEIYVPGGEEVALKTFNPQLGIVGGISILGTTGIVKPMSEEAYRQSLALKVKQLREEGETFGVLVPGNHGERIAFEEYGIAERYIIKTSNFIGYLLDVAADQGLERVLIIGHLGKLLKVAGGIFHTHNRTADARSEIMTSYVALHGGGQRLIREIFQAKTTDGMVELITNEQDAGLEEIYSYIAERIKERCERYVGRSLEVEVVVFTFEKGILAESRQVKSWLKEGWNCGEE